VLIRVFKKPPGSYLHPRFMSKVLLEVTALMPVELVSVSFQPCHSLVQSTWHGKLRRDMAPALGQVLVDRWVRAYFFRSVRIRQTLREKQRGRWKSPAKAIG
jgi:hypothetical protein